MACKIEENENMPISAILGEEPEHSEEENHLCKRKRNKRAAKRCRSNRKMRSQLEQLKQLRIHNKLLNGRVQLMERELGFLKELFVAVQAKLLENTTSDVLKNDLTKPESSS